MKDEYEYLWSAPDVIALPEHTDKDLALSIIRHVIALFRKSGRVVEKAVTDDIKEICEKNDILYAICMKVLRRCLTPTQVCLQCYLVYCWTVIVPFQLQSYVMG